MRCIRSLFVIVKKSIIRIYKLFSIFIKLTLAACFAESVQTVFSLGLSRREILKLIYSSNIRKIQVLGSRNWQYQLTMTLFITCFESKMIVELPSIRMTIRRFKIASDLESEIQKRPIRVQIQTIRRDLDQDRESRPRFGFKIKIRV